MHSDLQSMVVNGCKENWCQVVRAWNGNTYPWLVLVHQTGMTAFTEKCGQQDMVVRPRPPVESSRYRAASCESLMALASKP